MQPPDLRQRQSHQTALDGFTGSRARMPLAHGASKRDGRTISTACRGASSEKLCKHELAGVLIFTEGRIASISTPCLFGLCELMPGYVN